MSNLDITRGRSTALNLTNQTGATRNPGDIVVVDTTNNESFTTSTTSNYATGMVGVVDEQIGISSNGRIVQHGYARNVKVLGTASRGDFLYHSTTAATAAPMAGPTPALGAFGYVLKGGSGTAASALIFPPIVSPSRLPLGITTYAPGTDTSIGATTNTSLTDVDATNMIVTFTAPASGNVIVELEGLCNPPAAGNNGNWGLRESTTNLAQVYIGQLGVAVRLHATFYVTGVSAGSHTYKWAHSVTGGGTDTIYGGPNFGKAVMIVWAN